MPRASNQPEDTGEFDGLEDLIDSEFEYEELTGDEYDEDEFDPDFQATLQRAVEEALQWREENLDDELEKATDYYKARPFGDEREGRSQVVTTEVRDSVRAVLPGLLQVLAGSDSVVEFKPRGPEDAERAKLQTRYTNHVFMEENNGFMILHSAVKDALTHKMGPVRWGFEDVTSVMGYESTGLTEEEVALLSEDEYVTVRATENGTTVTQQLQPGPPGPDGQPGPPVPVEVTVPAFDVKVARRMTEGRIVVTAIPPEEFIFSPGATTPENATLCGQWQHKSASDLIAMGAPRELVERHRGMDTRITTNGLAEARRIDEGSRAVFGDVGDDSQEKVPCGELYFRYDEDDDGIAELYRVRVIGTSCEIWEQELVDCVPFAVGQYDPEPHTMVGMSIADYTMDLQHINSYVTRGMLDSLVMSLNPATEVVEGQVNLKDAMSLEIGRIIRTRAPGMIQPHTTEFVGAAALPVLEHLKALRAARIGMSEASEGLDPDVLQSTTRAAVQATVRGAQAQQELAVRMLAETLMRPLFKGLLKLIVAHRNKPHMVRLYGSEAFVEVDPREWDADADCVVNIALGSGMLDEKIERLMSILAKQEQHLMQGSPLVGFDNIRYTLTQLLEMLGHKNVDQYFKPFGAQEAAMLAQQQAQNKQPSEAEVLLQIEQMKAQARQQESQAKLQIEAAKLQIERARMQTELALKANEQQRKDRETAADIALDQARLQIERSLAEIQRIKTMSETRVGDAA